jgi:adenylate cyclase
MSGDPEQDYFADGVVEDVITALSRVGWFFVIARNSSFTYKGKAVDIKQVGRELGVRYVLEGSIRRAANRVRITGQLVEVATGHYIWADRFEGALDDIFDLQDRITESVVGAITPSLRRAEIARAYAKPTENLTAYDLYLRALDRFYTQLRPANDTAISLLRRAIRADPNYALAKALLSSLYVYRETAGWDQPGEAKIAIELARDALSSSQEDDPDTLRFAAHTLSHFAHEYDLALSILSRALRLNPNSAQILTISGWVHLHRNEPDQAIECFERAIRISPLDQEMGFILWGIGTSHLLAGRNEQGLAFLQASAREAPQWPPVHRTLILALVRLQRIEEARMAADRFLQLNPDYRVSQLSSPFSNKGYLEELRSTLLLVGIPE